MESRHLFSGGLTRGPLLEYFSNAAQCTSCHQQHWIELPQSTGQNLGVTVSPPSPLPIGLHHMPPLVTAQAEGMSRIWCDVFSHACLLDRSEFSSSNAFIPIRCISTGVSMMNDPADIHLNTVYLYTHACINWTFHVWLFCFISYM